MHIYDNESSKSCSGHLGQLSSHKCNNFLYLFVALIEINSQPGFTCHNSLQERGYYFQSETTWFLYIL